MKMKHFKRFVETLKFSQIHPHILNGKVFIPHVFNLDKIQIIGMSATIGNIDDLCKFLNADIFTQTFRPVTLKEYVKVNNQIFAFNKKTNELTLHQTVPTQVSSKLVHPMAKCPKILWNQKLTPSKILFWGIFFLI